MKNILYLGFNEQAILEIIDHDQFNLLGVVSQPNRVSNTMMKLLSVLEKPIYVVSKKSELKEYVERFDSIDYILSNKFGIIIPDEILEKYLCFNIHHGDLRINRGAYPGVWDILEKHDTAVSTLHKIGEKIDTGMVLSEYAVLLNDQDNLESIDKKLENGLKTHLDALANYDLNKLYEFINDGIYRKRINDDIITINEGDSLETIRRKIRSQSLYGGALLKYKDYILRVSEIITIDPK